MGCRLAAVAVDLSNPRARTIWSTRPLPSSPTSLSAAPTVAGALDMTGLGHRAPGAGATSRRRARPEQGALLATL